MRTLYPKMPKTFQYLKMDALEMDFGGEVFTTVFDKGLLDCICVSCCKPKFLSFTFTECESQRSKCQAIPKRGLQGTQAPRNFHLHFSRQQEAYSVP